MGIRNITSRTYGDLGVFQRSGANLFRSNSGRVVLLGKGNPGGKSEGALFLDQQRERVTGYDVPRSLVVCNEFFPIPAQPISSPAEAKTLDGQKVSQLIDTVRDLKMSSRLAIRSSALVEDQIGQTAAGAFTTEFHALPLDTTDSKNHFAAKLLAVLNSAYSERAARFWQAQGYTEIPPLSVIIQEVVGQEWKYAPRYFLPAVSGIVNTAPRKLVKISTVLGLGLAAVSAEGLGILHKLPILEDGIHVYHNMNDYKEELNEGDAYGLDLESGNVVHLRDQNASNLFPEDPLKKLTFNFPAIQMELASLGLRFERTAGFPFDLEWASVDGENIFLVQARPIRKRAEIERPNIPRHDIILSSQDVIGYGIKNFDYVIYVSCPDGSPPQKEIERLSNKYPNSLIIYATEVAGATNEQIVKVILPHSNAVIVCDQNVSGHVTGTGMQHFALDLEEQGKIFIYMDRLISEKLLGELVEKFEKKLGTYGKKIVKVFKPARRIIVAADDEFDRTVVCFEAER